MGVLVLGRETEREQGLRPLDVLRDLNGIGKLIDIAFADDIAVDGSQFLQDLAFLTAISPAMWALRRISGDMRDAFDGFVWIEDGRVVGNVTLTRDDAERSVWTASNVAVHPDYRRRGIARAMMLAAIDTVAERGGGILSLQVKAGNQPACNLYRDLGFVLVDGVVTMRPNGALPGPLPLAAQARTVRHGQWPQVLDLVRAARAPLAGQLSPLRQSDYQRGLVQRLADELGDALRQERRFWLAVGDERFAGAARLELRSFGGSTIELIMRPDADAETIDALVQSAIKAAGAIDRTLTVRADSSCAAARTALIRLNFSELRDLQRMLLEIKAQ